MEWLRRPLNALVSLLGMAVAFIVLAYIFSQSGSVGGAVQVGEIKVPVAIPDETIINQPSVSKDIPDESSYEDRAVDVKDDESIVDVEDGDRIVDDIVSNSTEAIMDISKDVIKKSAETVTDISKDVAKKSAETVTNISKDVVNNSNEINPETKEFLDGYEEFAEEYIVFMKKYLSSPSNMVSMREEFANMNERLAYYNEQIEKYNTDSMSKEEAKYFLEVVSRCSKKLMSVVGE